MEGCDVLIFELILKLAHCFPQLVSSDFRGVTATMRGGSVRWADGNRGMAHAAARVGTVLTESVGFAFRRLPCNLY